MSDHHDIKLISGQWDVCCAPGEPFVHCPRTDMHWWLIRNCIEHEMIDPRPADPTNPRVLIPQQDSRHKIIRFRNATDAMMFKMKFL